MNNELKIMTTSVKNKIQRAGFFAIVLFGLFLVAPISASAKGEIEVDYGGVTYTVDDSGNFSGGGITGTIDWSTGDFSVDGGGGGGGNITDLTGATVSMEVDGGTVSATIDDHSYEYQAEMFVAGAQYVEAVNNDNKEDAKIAVDRANQALQLESGGNQQLITVVTNSNGSISYGCVNTQNTRISFDANNSGNPSGGAVPSGSNPSGGGPSVNNNAGNVNGSGNNGSSGNGNNGTNGNNNNNNANNSNNAPVCTAQYFCTGNNLYYRNESCTESLSEQCQYSCSGSACVPTPSIQFTPFDATSVSGQFRATGHLQVKPLLLNNEEVAEVYWNAANASSCTVTGSTVAGPNGDSWSGNFSGASGKTTRKITTSTTFTLSCTALPGASPLSVTETQTVNLIPVTFEL